MLTTRDRRLLTDIGSCPIVARKPALTEWDKANSDKIYGPAVFRRESPSRLGTLKLSEIVAASSWKAYASDICRGKWTPHVLDVAEIGRVGRRCG